MNKAATLVLALVFCAPAARSGAQTLTPDEKAFFDQQISKIVEIVPKRVADPAVVKVFATPFYEVTVTIHEAADSTSTVKLMAARVGSEIVTISRPSGEQDLPDFPKMLNPAFRLATAADARTLQQAFDVVYPIIGTDDDKKAATSRRVGNQWIFVRGVFFDNKMGFVFETDAKGAITAVKFSLKLPS